MNKRQSKNQKSDTGQSNVQSVEKDISGESSLNDAERKKQYHPPICASLELEFRDNRDEITCEVEYNLNTKPNSIDFLVVKKNDEVAMKSGLGAIFKRYNIVEYKSPKDSLGEKIYFRTMGYAYLYIAYNIDSITMDEVTLTFVRHAKPIKLMKQLREWDFEIIEYESGIFHIFKPGHADMQIIVTRLLSRQYKWISKLTDRVELADVKELMKDIDNLESERDILNAESVFDLMTRLNKNKAWMKEVNGMGAFRDLFKEDFELRDKKIAEQTEMIHDLNEQLQSKDEQLHSKDEQLQNQSEQLKDEKEKNTRLQKEIEQLKQQMKEQMNKIAML